MHRLVIVIAGLGLVIAGCGGKDHATASATAGSSPTDAFVGRWQYLRSGGGIAGDIRYNGDVSFIAITRDNELMSYDRSGRRTVRAFTWKAAVANTTQNQGWKLVYATGGSEFATVRGGQLVLSTDTPDGTFSCFTAVGSSQRENILGASGPCEDAGMLLDDATHHVADVAILETHVAGISADATMVISRPITWRQQPTRFSTSPEWTLTIPATGSTWVPFLEVAEPTMLVLSEVGTDRELHIRLRPAANG